MPHGRWQKKIVHEVGPKDPVLTERENKQFEALKTEYVQIEKDSWKRKAEILKEIRDNRYYRRNHEYSTFAAFCKDVFDITRQRADQIIAAIATEQILAEEIGENDNHGCQNALSERHVRELQRLPSSQMRKAASKLKGKKITQKDVEKAVKDTKREAKAAKSGSIAGHVHTAMATAEEIAKQCRAIKAGCTGLHDILQGPFGVHMPTGQPLDQIKKLASLIAAGAPYADCVYCGSRGGNCKGCDGHGWVTKGQFNAMPYELKAKSKVRAEDEAA